MCCRREGASSPSCGAEGCAGTGQVVFSLQRCLFPQQSKGAEQNPLGFRPQYMPAFLSTCMYMFTFLSLARLESTAPFHEGLMYTKEQARKKQTGGKRRPNWRTPAAQKSQAAPTHVFPHPPHQWGGPVAEHGAVSIDKPQHPGVRRRKFPAPRKNREKLPSLHQDLQLKCCPNSLCKEG